MIKRDEKYDGELRGSTERPLVQTGITAVGEKEANEAEEELDGGPLEVEIEEFYKSEEELESTVSEDNFTKIMRDKYGRCRSVPKATPPRLNRMSTDKYEANWGQFVTSRGNEYFCDIDEEYLTDRFNLTGLNTEVQYYQYALDLITDVFDLDCDDEMREAIERSARHLYGLVHARYIITTRGQHKMMEKFKNADFGKCPRVACHGQNLLPSGQHDIAGSSTVALYCARCEDIYSPKSSRHACIDGAYFGSSFAHMFFLTYPNLQPPKTSRRYEPRVFGFRVHAAAALARWQTEQKERLMNRLSEEGMETGFEGEDDEGEDMEDSGDEEGEGQDGIDDMFEGRGTVRM